MQRCNGLRIEFDAIRNTNVSFLVVCAAAGVEIEQFARDAGAADAMSILVFEFQSTALGTAVAQRFPLFARQFGERFRAPERIVTHV